MIGYLSADYFYRYTYDKQLRASYESIEQLQKTVLSTASVAAYLGDRDLANEVVAGLMNNDLILAASIATETEALAAAGQTGMNGALHFQLPSPFIPDAATGSMELLPNVALIEARARTLGKEISLALSVQAISVTLISIVICFFLITRPMVSVAHWLHRIVPGTPARLLKPTGHAGSELGHLVDDINILLGKAEQQITEERRLREKIELLERRFRLLFENSAAAIMLTDKDFGSVIFNHTFEAMLEKLNVELQPDYQRMVEVLFMTPSAFHNLVKSAIELDNMMAGDFKLKSTDKAVEFWVHAVIISHHGDGEQEFLQIFLHDISKRKAEMKELSHKANYDKLTNLMNRQAAERSIQQLMTERTGFALLLLDLDGFKPINDEYGHDAGDAVLKAISSRISGAIRKGDIAARWGGDEFVVVLKQVTPEEVASIVDKWLPLIKAPVALPKDARDVAVGASIGAACYPEDAAEFDTLLAMADQAMYQVKRVGKHGLAFYRNLV